MKDINIAFHQPGARRNYALPLALYQQGLLEHLFTDFYAYSWMIKWAKVIEKLSNGKIFVTEKLSKRRQNDLPDDKVSSLDWLFFLSSPSKKIFLIENHIYLIKKYLFL